MPSPPDSRRSKPMGCASCVTQSTLWHPIAFRTSRPILNDYGVDMTSLIPSAVSVWRATRVTAIEGVFSAEGVHVEVEAGPIGLIIYGDSQEAVTKVAKVVVASAHRVDKRAEVEHVGIDRAEPAKTQWHAVVTFDWSKMGGLL